MQEQQTFNFSDYDCIGFDLDNTIAKFKIGASIDLEYKILAKFLVKRGYSKDHLERSIDYDFIQKGLILDSLKGNILKIAGDGKILRATHGSKQLSTKEIEKIYPNGHWELTDLLIKDPLELWNGPKSQEMRSLLDYFDVVVSLLFARCVDSIDEEKGGVQQTYSIYDDIYEGLWDIFKIDHFQTNQGEYYPELKSNPSKYYHKCSENVINWLKTLKSQRKLLFLITGSYIDFASLTASYALGADWKEYFDIIITYAKKPGFFTMKRNFIGLNGISQTGDIEPDNLELGGTYVNGNWQDLHQFLSKHSQKQDSKFLYIGDSIIQDVYTPNVHSHCDTVAVCEELYSDKKYGSHPDEKVIVSEFWGSYFQEKNVDTIWNKMMIENAKLCIPDLEYAARLN